MTPCYSMGCGDRFGRQGEAQLSAFVDAAKLGIDVVPVWNKSHREHTTVHTTPESVRAEAAAAVRSLGWNKPYFVDADHISLKTVDGFIDASDFFTLDVAENIGEKASDEDLSEFLAKTAALFGPVRLPGLEVELAIDGDQAKRAAAKYLSAVQQAGRIHRHVAGRKKGPFMVEVSMDETDEPQTPVELLLILAMIAQEGIPVDTIAPKFSGRFNKGVDYVGDVALFAREFEQDVAVLALAPTLFGLEKVPRLSVHSGSDKFAIYPIMNRIVRKHGAGLHVKTAGTTWLEEVVGLAEAGGSGLAVARKIYAAAHGRYGELAAPYASVIDIDPEKLPPVAVVDGWSNERFANALRHDPSCPDYDPAFRQLIHVAYKVAYELGGEYTRALDEHAAIIGRNVAHNLLNRHILPIFGNDE